MNFLDSRIVVHYRLWNSLGNEVYASMLHPLLYDHNDHIATELWDSLGDRMAYQLLLDQLEEDHARC